MYSRMICDSNMGSVVIHHRYNYLSVIQISLLLWCFQHSLQLKEANILRVIKIFFLLRWHTLSLGRDLQYGSAGDLTSSEFCSRYTN